MVHKFDFKEPEWLSMARQVQGTKLSSSLKQVDNYKSRDSESETYYSLSTNSSPNSDSPEQQKSQSKFPTVKAFKVNAKTPFKPAAATLSAKTFKDPIKTIHLPSFNSIVTPTHNLSSTSLEFALSSARKLKDFSSEVLKEFKRSSITASSKKIPKASECKDLSKTSECKDLSKTSECKDLSKTSECKDLSKTSECKDFSKTLECKDFSKSSESSKSLIASKFIKSLKVLEYKMNPKTAFESNKSSDGQKFNMNLIVKESNEASKSLKDENKSCLAESNFKIVTRKNIKALQMIKSVPATNAFVKKATTKPKVKYDKQDFPVKSKALVKTKSSSSFKHSTSDHALPLRNTVKVSKRKSVEKTAKSSAALINKYMESIVEPWKNIAEAESGAESLHNKFQCNNLLEQAEESICPEVTPSSSPPKVQKTGKKPPRSSKLIVPKLERLKELSNEIEVPNENKLWSLKAIRRLKKAISKISITEPNYWNLVANDLKDLGDFTADMCAQKIEELDSSKKKSKLLKKSDLKIPKKGGARKWKMDQMMRAIKRSEMENSGYETPRFVQELKNADKKSLESQSTSRRKSIPLWMLARNQLEQLGSDFIAEFDSETQTFVSDCEQSEAQLLKLPEDSLQLHRFIQKHRKKGEEALKLKMKSNIKASSKKKYNSPFAQEELQGLINEKEESLNKDKLEDVQQALLWTLENCSEDEPEYVKQEIRDLANVYDLNEIMT